MLFETDADIADCVLGYIENQLGNEAEVSALQDQLLAEISKEVGESADYLDTNRAYRTEKDVFDDFTQEERKSNVRRSTCYCMGKCTGLL